MYYPRAGTQHWVVPLLPPQCLEFLAIVNREHAASGDVGAEVLAAEAANNALFSWAVLVDDLDAMARCHSLEIDDYTLQQPDRTLRGWRTASGPSHLPFFIDYPNNGNRPERLMAGTSAFATPAARLGSVASSSRGTQMSCLIGLARMSCQST